MAPLIELLALSAVALRHSALAQEQQSSTTADAPSTTSASSQPADTADAVWFPLLGISDNPFLDWGVNVSTLPPSLKVEDIKTNAVTYAIAVNNSNPVTPEIEAKFGHGNEIPIVKEAKASSDLGFLKVATNGDTTLVLGLNSTLNFTSDGRDDIVMPTVPFGINLGRRGAWSGSITLGGRFDANRISSTSWLLLAETSTGNTTFLLNGTQTAQAELKSRTASVSVTATIDINNDAFILPQSLSCSEEFGILLRAADNSDHVLQMNVPTNLTSSPFRCKQATSPDSPVVFGRPFFQVAYAYLNPEGNMYLAAAHQYKVDIDAKPFDPTATLTPIAPPPADAKASPTPNAASSLKPEALTSLGPIALCVGLAGISLLTSLKMFSL